MSGNNQPVLCYSVDRAAFNQGQNAQFNIGIDDSGIAHTLVAKGPGAVATFSQQRIGQYSENNVSSNLTAREYKSPSDLIVAYGVDCRNGTENEDLMATLQAHEGGGFSLNSTHPVRIGTEIRRLTPTECARLQGMPDWWCDNIPHADSAEYKMWGNGMALPCVMYVFEGVRNLLRSRWLDTLLEG